MNLIELVSNSSLRVAVAGGDSTQLCGPRATHIQDTKTPTNSDLDRGISVTLYRDSRTHTHMRARAYARTHNPRQADDVDSGHGARQTADLRLAVGVIRLRSCRRVSRNQRSCTVPLAD